MVNIMIDSRFRKSYSTANEFIKQLNTTTNATAKDYVETAERILQCKIEIFSTSFKEQSIEEPYGAMMRTLIEQGALKEAQIILNSDIEDSFSRKFSLLHEIGHLFVEGADSFNFPEKGRHFVVSTHINYSLRNIPASDYNNSEYLLNEQRANVFALLVIMPNKEFFSALSMQTAVHLLILRY